MRTSVKPKELLAHLFGEYRKGNRAAIGQLVECFYPELRQLAAMRMRHERAGHTWQPTILVHELYLELARAKPSSDFAAKDEEAAFFGLAGYLMNRLLIHHARPLAKRVDTVPTDEIDLKRSENTVHEIDEALERLAAIHPELSLIVEMKVFEGLSEDEIAEKLGHSRRTIARRWSFARRWLEEEYVVKSNTGFHPSKAEAGA
jgi:RNA polymerase sigma factor (TIGR02999 family)